MENGTIDMLILWENLDYNRLTLKDSDGNVTTETVHKDKITGNKWKNEKGVDCEIIENLTVTEWLLDNYKRYVTHLEIVTDKSSEGNQFVKGFGGIGGILRYKIETNFEDDEDNHSFDEDDFI